MTRRTMPRPSPATRRPWPGGGLAFGDKVLYKQGWCYDHLGKPGPGAAAFLRIAREFPGSDLVAWTKTVGASPIAYIQFGDSPRTYADPNFRRILTNAIHWAASA